MASASRLKAICIYCGSSTGVSPAYRQAATRLGQMMGEAGIGLVYGGGGVGLMGVVARAARQAGSKVVGIIPDFLYEREGQNIELDERIIVSDMHTRKRLMFERSDAFVALPGGIGTLEELIEMLTWSQLGRHGKPIVIANVAGFWGPLNELLQHMFQEGFIRNDPTFSPRYQVVDDVEDVLCALEAGLSEKGMAMPLAKF